jgi:hypothetical protein
LAMPLYLSDNTITVKLSETIFSSGHMLTFSQFPSEGNDEFIT